ncbi:MAG: hypothetical protein F6K39_02825 [Okeania sp. SIO3B3]|nr:hypothetical protein [Okeania sp. SIO3B3]
MTVKAPFVGANGILYHYMYSLCVTPDLLAIACYWWMKLTSLLERKLVVLRQLLLLFKI